jgi:hypothetical protein
MPADSASLFAPGSYAWRVRVNEKMDDDPTPEEQSDWSKEALFHVNDEHPDPAGQPMAHDLAENPLFTFDLNAARPTDKYFFGGVTDRDKHDNSRWDSFTRHFPAHLRENVAVVSDYAQSSGPLTGQQSYYQQLRGSHVLDQNVKVVIKTGGGYDNDGRVSRHYPYYSESFHETYFSDFLDPASMEYIFNVYPNVIGVALGGSLEAYAGYPGGVDDRAGRGNWREEDLPYVRAKQGDR